MLGDTAAIGVETARLSVRRINAGKDHQGFLGLEPAHIADLSHEMRTEGWADAEHIHHYGELRECGGQIKHLLFERPPRLTKWP